MASHEAGPTRALLFGLLLPGSEQALSEGPLEELATLARAAGAEVVGEVLQRRQAPDAATYLGSGKVAEMAEVAETCAATLAICDQDLSPAQGRNLEKALGRRVLDRTELILDLFATRARTSQARAQVELARLEYSLPRLRRLWGHLDRERGGIGLRGTGEKQIESDRRLIRVRILDLKRTLVELEARALRRVESRRGRLRVCLVGYASAGKSSLLNALTGADVLVAARPFSTLDTRTRVLDLGQGHSALLSDTVGFIRDIPHHLVASFHATLAEAVHSDLLLHVVDVSRPTFEKDVAVVDGVLASIGAIDVPRRLLLNKVDLLPDRMPLQLAGRLFPGALPVSAVTGEGLCDIREALVARLFVDPTRVVLRVPAAQPELLSVMRRNGSLVSEEWDEEGAVVELLASRELVDALIRKGCRPLEKT